MGYRSSETVQRSGYFQSSVSYIKGPNNVYVEKIMSKRKKMYVKMKYKNKRIQWQDGSINWKI